MPATAAIKPCSRVPLSNVTQLLEATRDEWEPQLAGLMKKGNFVLGDEVASFEREFAASMGGRFAVGVGTGTDAISLSLRAARIQGEVCTTALTAPFTALAIRAAGLKVRFVDVNEESLQMEPGELERQLTKEVSAVVAVHLYGQPCAVEEIAEITRARGITLIQDACQAHGANSGTGHPFTHYGDYVAYSFYPTKNLGCLGDGGAIVTMDAAVNRRLRLLRDGGRRRGHVSWVAGINSRLDEIQACFLRVFLRRLTESNRTRRQLAELYDEALAGCPGVRPVRRSGASVCHLYVIRAERREALREWLREDGIDTGIHYSMPLHLHPAFRGSNQARGSLPRAEEACRTILSLPLWTGMDEGTVCRIAARIRSFYS